MKDAGISVYNLLEDLAPEIKTELRKKEAYQRFIFERARLDKIAAKSWADTGKLNSSEALEQKEIVTALGNEVLEEIKAIQFMRDEPSYEEFQKLKKQQ